MFQILKLLRELGHRVTFIPDNLANIFPYAAELQKRGIKVLYQPYLGKVRDYLISHGSEFDVVILAGVILRANTLRTCGCTRRRAGSFSTL